MRFEDRPFTVFLWNRRALAALENGTGAEKSNGGLVTEMYVNK